MRRRYLFMKRSVLTTIIATLIAFAPVFPTGEKADNQNNDLDNRTTAFAAYSACSIGFVLGTAFFGSPAYRELKEVQRHVMDLQNAEKMANAALKEAQALRGSYAKHIKDIALIVKGKQTFGSGVSDTNMKKIEDYLQVRKKIAHVLADSSLDAHNAWQINKTGCLTKLSASSRRIAAYGFAAAGCAYGTYWFGKNAYKQIYSSKEQQ